MAPTENDLHIVFLHKADGLGGAECCVCVAFIIAALIKSDFVCACV